VSGVGSAPNEAAASRGTLARLERLLAAAAFTAMTVLPVSEMISRHWGVGGIPGSTVFVQHLTLWIAFIGAALAAWSGRLLSLSANTFLSETWARRARVFVSILGAATTICLAWASARFVEAERLAGATLAAGIPRWLAQAAMPAGFLAVAIGIVWHASPSWRGRLLVSAGACLPVAFGVLPAPHSNVVLVAGVGLVLTGALLGLPIFATLGAIATLLFWNEGVPVAAVPVETYRLVASPVLPSIPLFTFAGYLLVKGGADRRLLGAYQALLGWLPGGLAITTAVVCAIFTWAGSGVTILAMGGLLLPMLVKARYPDSFSMGLINASGSLGLLFPPSLPVILYGIYAQTPIDELFVGGFLPGMLMVLMVSSWGVMQAVRNHAERTRFNGREALRAVWHAKWDLAIPVIVLIGLFGGFGTLVEAGAIAVAYALIVERFAYRTFSLRRDYGEVARECATVVGGVLLIVGVAVGFTNYLVDAQLPRVIIEWTSAHIHSKYLFLLLLNLVLLLKGSFMDVFSAIIVLVPLITPIAEAFGIERVQLGIIFLANLELGYLTPPVGMNLCLSAYRFERPMASIYRATLPFYLILLAGVLLITYVPWMTMGPVHWFAQR
jgi:tripartite ATP-independent transporter DctM subunit